MAVDTRAPRIQEEPRRGRGQRDTKVPLRKKMGTGWDVAT
jgi:hypothetical protein